MKKLIGAEIKSLQNMIARQLDNHFMQVGDCAISGPNAFMLKYLKDNPDKDIFQKDFEQILSTTKSTCSKVLSKMEEKGFIKREGVSDARYRKIILLPRGKEIVEKTTEFIDEYEKKMLTGLTDEQIETFLECITVMKKNISQD